jgi:hypothetical protein
MNPMSNSPETPTPALTRRVSLEIGTVADVPVLTCIPQMESPCPVVFYIPGFTGERASGLSLAYQLAGRGIAYIGIDPLYHGSRHDARLLDASNPAYGGVYPPESGIDVYLAFLRVIEQSATDIKILLGALTGDARLDLNRAGVTGFSMGAYATFLAFGSIKELKAAVPMMGIPTFTQRWLDLLDECAWTNPVWGAALTQLENTTRDKTSYVQRIDPAEWLRHAAPKPLFLMSGDFDYDQMKTYALSWYRQSKDAWKAHPEHLKWNVYPVGHTVTAQMEQDTVDWFVTHLPVSESV